MHVLLIEDNDGDAELVADALANAGHKEIVLARVERLAVAIERLNAEPFDVVLLDLSLPDASGLEGLQRLRSIAPQVPIVVLTGLTDVDVGTRAIQNGAQDYLEKGRVDGPDLLRAIRYARERAQLADRARLLSEVGIALGSSFDPEGMLATLRGVLTRDYADACFVDALRPAEQHPGERSLGRGVTPAPRPSRLYTSMASAQSGDLDRARREELVGQGITSLMVVPFDVSGWSSGSITFGRTAASTPFGSADLPIAEEIARRAVAAVEYAELLRVAESERERAEVAGRARDEFLATLSHELRTPLNAILGWTQMLRANQVPAEKQARALETIERNARSQVALIDDVLDVSRIITGKIRLRVSTLEIAQVLASALDTVRPAAEAKGVHLQVDAEPGVTIVQADPDRILQVLWNLLSNAVKFTPRGGKVFVQLRRRDSFVDVVVTDTGQGIPREFLPHVFERFRQGDATSTRMHGGLGLGLAIARHLVELHGGTLRVESEGSGAGATFVMTLPKAAQVTSSSSEPPYLRSPVPDAAPFVATALAGVTILVVDDDPDTRTLLCEILERSGAKVVTASSMEEGLAAVRQHRPDLLVSDIGMPGASGYDFIQCVRALPPSQGGSIPAIALTAYARAEDRALALRVGFDQHVSKPIAPSELVAVVVSLRRRLRSTS